MKDLYYILIDYGRCKDLEKILDFKIILKTNKFFRYYAVFLILMGIVLIAAAIRNNFLLMIFIFFVLFCSLIPLCIKQDEKFSMFGSFPRWKAFWRKDSEKTVLNLTTKKESSTKNVYSGDDVPVWFAEFLEEKGINKNNVNYLIDELSIKYDYPVRKLTLNIILFFVAFFGWSGIKEIKWSISLISLVVLGLFILGLIVFVIEKHYKSKKESIHPLISIKGKKEELIHDLNLMKMKWFPEVQNNNSSNSN